MSKKRKIVDAQLYENNFSRGGSYMERSKQEASLEKLNSSYCQQKE
ncbi:unnamed protein product [Brassica oleracea]